MSVLDTARRLDHAGGSNAWVARMHALAGRFWPLTVIVLVASLPAHAVIGRSPNPEIRIPLERLGYQAQPPEFLRAGSSMLTLDFIDRDHLLVTFSVRRLMKREVNPPPGEEDRTISACVVELPSGKVLTRTEWRVHDRGQYLWNLGQGRFMLRLRDQLTTFVLRDFSDPGRAFRQVPLLTLERHIVAVLVSADSDLLTVETTKWAMGSGAGSKGFSAEPAPVQISFYRLANSPAEGLRVISAGTVRTRTAVSLPLTTAGRLEVRLGGKDRWLFDFEQHSGKVETLAQFDTSCSPRAVFVGHSEFVAFGCRGSRDKVDLAGFNFKGEETWQQNFYDTHVDPTFSFAPGAGRFALGRTIVTGDVDADAPLPTEVVSAQEVRVYQSYSGKQLLRIECTPVMRAGQNFALSPDGLRLAVVRETMMHHAATKELAASTEAEAGVEVYTLPALTAKDTAAVNEARTLAPPDTGARIDLALARGVKSTKDAAEGPGLAGGSGSANVSTMPAANATPVLPHGPQVVSATEAGAEGQAESDAESEPRSGASGDPQPASPRKPPTLYGPDETPRKPK